MIAVVKSQADRQVSNGNRGGSTGYLYDCVWRGAGLSPDTRCTYDVTVSYSALSPLSISRRELARPVGSMLALCSGPQCQASVEGANDAQGARVTYQNQGVNRCPVNLCTAIKTGTENRRRRSVFDERAEMLRRHQVDTGVLRRRNSARKAIARAVMTRDRQ